jgi:16S rRNA (guanine1207-N2)-methyltransferase
VAKAFIEEGYKHLVFDGKFMMVTKRLAWYRNKISSVFGGVKVFEQDGYYVFVAEKRRRCRINQRKEKQKLSKKLERKYGSTC